MPGKPRKVAAHVALVAARAGVDPYLLRDWLAGRTLQVPATRRLMVAADWVRMREAALEATIARDVRHCNMNAGYERYLRYHTYRSTHSPEGFPDEVVIDTAADGVEWRWENKIEGGRATPDQDKWLRAIDKVAQHSNGTVRCLGIMTPSRWAQEGRTLVLCLGPELSE